MMNKKILALVLALIVAVILASIFITTKKDVVVTTGFNILVAPGNSQIYLDGKKIKSGINQTEPGKHSIVVKHNDFTTHKSIVESKLNKIVPLPIGLEPSTAAGVAWKQKNGDEYTKLQAIGDQNFESESKAAVDQYPIISELPKDMSPLFRIDYGISKKYPSSEKIALYVSSRNPVEKQNALSYIYGMGYDPSDYEIIFEGL